MYRRASNIITAFAWSALITLSAVTSSYAGRGASPTFAGSPFDLVSAVNALRASYGLAPYRISPILMYTAQSQADFLAATGTMTHTGPGGSGLTDRLLAAGYPLAGELAAGGFRAENITGGNESMPTQAAVDQWAADELHLDTMISPNLTEIGAGVAVSNGRVYYVIDCAQSKTTAAPEAPSAVAMISTPNSNGEVIHEVQLGQTLWQLAIAYNVKIEEIRALNNLLDNSISAGTKLLIKTGVLQPTAVHTGLPAGHLTVTALSTAAIVQPALAATTGVASSPPANTNTIIGVMISIIMLALLGGGLFTWIGNSKK